MEKNKIKMDNKKIEWFVRGSSDKVVLWYLNNKEKIHTWMEFKVEYICRFGSEEDKEKFIYISNQDELTVGEFTRKLLQVVASKKKVDVTLVCNIIHGIKDINIIKEFRKRMWKRPKNIPHEVWLAQIVKRWEIKTEAKGQRKKIIEDSKRLKGSEQKNVGNQTKSVVEKSKTTEHTSIKKDAGKLKAETKQIFEKEKDVEQAKNNNCKAGEKIQQRLREENMEQLDKSVGDRKCTLLKRIKQRFKKATNNEIKYREPCKIIKCEINTPEGKQICVPGKRRVEQSMIERTKEQLLRLEEAKIIQKSESKWRSPIRPVEKPDKSIRICTNLITLNEIVTKKDYPTPIMNDLIEKTQGSKWFTVIDLKDGYFQIEIKEEDKRKTAFKFDNAVYEWARMPMGFKNAPSIFQKMMDNILGDLTGKGVEAYLDDIVVHAKTKEEHETLLFEVFKRLEENNLYINIKKLQLEQEEITLLGVKINGKTQKLVKESQKDILEYPKPTDTKRLRRFLGKMNFYSSFIKDIGTIAITLYEKTGKYAKFE